jgi:hypothetical protein
VAAASAGFNLICSCKKRTSSCSEGLLLAALDGRSDCTLRLSRRFAVGPEVRPRIFSGKFLLNLNDLPGTFLVWFQTLKVVTRVNMSSLSLLAECFS